MSKLVNGLKMKFTVISAKGLNMLDVINKLSHAFLNFLHLQQNVVNIPENI